MFDLKKLKEKIINKIKRRKWNVWILLYGKVVIRLVRERYSYRASALSFITLLNIVPLLSVLVFLTAKLPQFSQIMDMARTYVVKHFMPSSSEMVGKQLGTFSQQAAELPIISLVSLLVTVIMLGRTIQDALSDVWKRERITKSTSLRVLQWLMLILTPFFIGIGVALSSYIFSLSWLRNQPISELNIVLGFVISLFLNTGVLTLFYSAISDYEVRWRDRCIGAFTAAVLFEIGQLGFSFYVTKIGDYELVYGAMASIPIFLMWVYISWLIVILGALVIDTRYQMSKDYHKGR